MAFFGLFGSKTPQTILVEDIDGKYFYYLMNKLSSLGNSIQNYQNCNAYAIAETLPEVFIPIDLISDKVGGLDYFLIDKNGKKVEKIPANISRLIKKPNPFQSFSSFVYQLQFSQLAAGFSCAYPVISDISTRKTENITSIYAIKPYNLDWRFNDFANQNSFFAKSINDFVKKFVVQHFTQVDLVPEKLIFEITSTFDFNAMEVLSPLSAVSKNINNLLAVYQARYNAYIKNGAAGILSRKQAQDGDLSQFAQDGELRQKMVEEMQKTDGINGNKNFIGISSIPLEFIKTIGTISELQPFDETKIDLITIGGIFGISQHLLPTGDGATFSNQQDAEKFLWQNLIKPYATAMCSTLNDCFILENTGYSFSVSFDEIEVLQEDRGGRIAADMQELDLYDRLKTYGIDNQEILNKWKQN